jgi:hypothetical protein
VKARAPLGGVVTTSELRQLGYDTEVIGRSLGYGTLVRVRRGWYALRGTPSEVLEAVRVGGRLACVSALVHYGLLPPEGGPLHVEVPSNASRLRLPERDVVVHWVSRPGPGDRLAVSIATALGQASRCRGGRQIGSGTTL